MAKAKTITCRPWDPEKTIDKLDDLCAVFNKAKSGTFEVKGDKVIFTITEPAPTTG